MNGDASHRAPTGNHPPVRSPRDRRARIALPTGERFNGRWTRRQWALASLVATLGMLVAAIVPGFSDATRPAPLTSGYVTQALALPKLPMSRKRSQPGDSWQLVTVESTREQIVWGAATITLVMATGFLKDWMFSRMNMLTVLREVKRLQLQIAMLEAPKA